MTPQRIFMQHLWDACMVHSFNRPAKYFSVDDEPYEYYAVLHVVKREHYFDSICFVADLFSRQI